MCDDAGPGTRIQEVESDGSDTGSGTESPSTDLDLPLVEDNDSNGTTAEETERWRFVVFCDSRGTDSAINVPVFAALITEILKQKPDLVIFPGDLVLGQMSDVKERLFSWIELTRPLYEAGIAVYPVRGNHDLEPDGGSEAWESAFSGGFALPDNGPPGEKQLTYFVAHKNALFVGMDLYIPGNSKRVNRAWLEGVLASNLRPHVFVYAHEPAFATYHADCMDDYPEERDAFWASLKAAGVRAFFAGHDHFLDHSRVIDGDGNADNDIHQIIVGTAGAPLYSFMPPYGGINSSMGLVQLEHREEYGFLLVTMDGPAVSMTWVPLEGPPKKIWEYSTANFTD